LVKKLIDGFFVPNTALLIFIPLSASAILVGYSHLLQNPAENWNLALFAIVISLISVGLIYVIQLILKKLLTSSLSLGASITVLIIVVGLFRGVLMNNFIYLIISPEIDSGNRIFSSALTTVVWLGLLSLTINSRDKFKQKFEALISQAILNRFTLISHSELTRELAKIEDDLKGIHMPLKDALLSSTGFKQVAQEVESLVQDSIRPLSHKLWSKSSAKIPKFNVFFLLRETLTNLNYPFGVLLLLASLTTFLNLSTVIPLEQAIIRALIVVVVVIFLHYLNTQILKRYLKLTLILGIGYLSLIAVVPNMLGDFITKTFLPVPDIPIVFIAYLIIPGLAFLLSYIREVQKSRIEILKSVESDLNLEDKSDLEYLESLQLASYLHNNLANEYRSIGRQLENLSDNPQSQQARQAIEQLGALINRSISDDFKEFYESPLARLKKLPNAWQGILDLAIKLPEEFLLTPQKAVLTTQIVEELVSNTVAHLNVTRLNIEIFSNENDEIKIVADNDGRFVKSKNQGIGKIWIQSIAVTDLKEEQTKSGYKVTIII
jgi:hypothetical protein